MMPAFNVEKLGIKPLHKVSQETYKNEFMNDKSMKDKSHRAICSIDNNTCTIVMICRPGIVQIRKKLAEGYFIQTST